MIINIQAILTKYGPAGSLAAKGRKGGMKFDYHNCLRNGRNQHCGVFNTVVLGGAPGAENKKGYCQQRLESALLLSQKASAGKERPR
ncbi:MAG: hypothetical protein PHI24_10840 [Desulfitobacteriaceae bacterium]|nr:hypothetical protein [Desulfitobacteriaceae bacterium]